MYTIAFTIGSKKEGAVACGGCIIFSSYNCY
eukprot:SAG22_NODE_7298_length_754_cov_1.007634_1_plen_30_part_10